MNPCVILLAMAGMFVFGVGLAVIAAVIVGGRADDAMEDYWSNREHDEDPPTGI